MCTVQVNVEAESKYGVGHAFQTLRQLVVQHEDDFYINEQVCPHALPSG